MDARTQLLIWTAAASLAGIIAILLALRMEQGRWLARLDASTAGATLREVAVFGFCVGLPAMLLIAGVLSTDSLGIPDGQSWSDWLRGAGLAASAAAASIVSLRLSARSLGAAPPSAGWTAARDTLYLETLWAFLRAAPSLWLDDQFWGVLAGAALGLAFFAALGRFSPPRTPAVIGQLGVDLACLLASSLVFFSTRNLPLCMAAHAAIRLAAGWRPRPSAAPQNRGADL